jgi:3-oxoacyl-[acyl-carrier-protein] synthase II
MNCGLPGVIGKLAISERLAAGFAGATAFSSGFSSITRAAGAASSIVELVGSILALKHGQLPPTLNFVNADPECPVYVHAKGLRPVTKPYAIKIGFTDAGQTAVAVLRKWEG